VPPRARPRTVLIVTYTMSNPAAVGVFFRALRLGFELTGRGHRVAVLNCGPLPGDPKLDAARERLALHELPWQGPEFGLPQARARLASFRPNLVVFGEGPFDTMEMVFRAARGLWAPFILLDQYYQDWLVTRRRDLDRILLYGLASFLRPGEFAFDDRYRLVPPFIAAVTPRHDLPVPAALAALPWVTVLGFEPMVLRRGIELVAALPEPRPAVVLISHDPPAARRLASERGLDPARVAAPGLAADAELFGFIAAAAVVVLANGYMQIMEALALGRPAICVMRGIGLEGWTVDDRYKPYVSIDEDMAAQGRRLAGWLAAPPFPPELASRLGAERHGAGRVADLAEELLAKAWRPRELWRRARRVARSRLSARP
jgi:hypothetical protein